jgi:cytochrome c oxidase cbb3-type subunit 1/cytochrome c oxidase cbb3-type subunit I/II
VQAEVINRRLVKFIWAAAIFFAWCCIQGVVQEQETVRAFLMTAGPLAGLIKGAHSHVGCMGWAGLGLAGVLYYLVPTFSGKSIVWPGLVNWVFWIWVIGTAVGNAMMITIGIVGGNAFIAGITQEAQLMAMVMPYFILMGICAYLEGIGAIMFVVQILVTLTRGSKTTS